MRMLRTFVEAVLAGISISIGGTVFLLTENGVLGAIFFTVGLFTVCVFGFSLFTGKICYVFDGPPRTSGKPGFGWNGSLATRLPVIWLGNLTGSLLMGFLEMQTRLAPRLTERAAQICQTKLSQGWLSAFLLAVLCDIMIYIAVEGYKSIPQEIGKYLAVFFGVTVFVLCGFEHCVANMYYFTVGQAWTGWETIAYLLVMTAGNAVGGVLIPLLRKVGQTK